MLSKYFLPEHFLTLNIDKEARILERVSGKQHGEATLNKLREAAQNSIGIPKAGSDVTAARLTLASWLTLLEVLEQQLQRTMAELLALVEQTPYFEILTSIKGIFSKLAALFTHYKQLEKYAGFQFTNIPKLRQSKIQNPHPAIFVYHDVARGLLRLLFVGNERLPFMLAHYPQKGRYRETE